MNNFRLFNFLTVKYGYKVSGYRFLRLGSNLLEGRTRCNICGNVRVLAQNAFLNKTLRF